MKTGDFRSNRQSALVFSQWSRKSYAAFASLHRTVRIATLAVDMLPAAERKNQIIPAIPSTTSTNEIEPIQHEITIPSYTHLTISETNQEEEKYIHINPKKADILYTVDAGFFINPTVYET